MAVHQSKRKDKDVLKQYYHDDCLGNALRLLSQEHPHLFRDSPYIHVHAAH